MQTNEMIKSNIEQGLTTLALNWFHFVLKQY